MEGWTTVIAVVLVSVSSLVLLYKRWMSKRNRDVGDDSYLRKKFTVKDGITFFDCDMSPCARRVRTTLYEKGIKHNVVEVDIMRKENRHPSFLAINPLGKIPAMVVRNVEGIPNCYLYESNAITEWLDEQFPDTIQLYPSDPWKRAQVKMWQRWEAAMAEDFWPFMYANVMGFINRALYSRPTFQKHLSKGDPYQASKWMKVYDGELLTARQMQSTAIRLYKWLDLLENALDDKTYLCGDSFTTADLSVLPRVVLYPVIGFLTTDKERSRYPNLIRYMSRLASRKSIRDADRAYLKTALMKWLPWSVIEWIGNWRSGKKHHRLYGEDVLQQLETSMLELPIPAEPILRHSNIVLYSHIPWPDAIATRIACLELGIQAEVKETNMMYLEQRSARYLTLSPYGEVPTACHQDKIIYDPKNIIEYLDAVFSSASSTSLIPEDPTDRVHMRMWQGWVNTCFNYQLIHLYRQCIIAPVLKSKFSSKADLLEVLQRSTSASEYISDVVDFFTSDLSSEEIESKMSPYKLGLGIALEHLDRQLEGKEYLVSSKLSAADISVFSLLMLFKWVGVTITDSKYSNASAWMRKVLSIPSFSMVRKEVDDYMLSHGLQNN